MPSMTRRRPRAAATSKAPRARKTSGRRRQPEEAIQIAVVAHLRKHGVRFFHVPNGSKASAGYRAKLWSLGLEAGVPDIVIVDKPYGSRESLSEPTPWAGAALELKADKGRPSDEQKQWLSDLAVRGWATAITYGLDEALAQLRAWGYLPAAPSNTPEWWAENQGAADLMSSHARRTKGTR